MSVEIPPHEPVPEYQTDSVTLVASPVSGQKYEWRAGASGAGATLGAQKNVRIISVAVKVTWAVTQPNPTEVHLTIDGKPIIHTTGTIVSNTPLDITVHPQRTPADQRYQTSTQLTIPYIYEGRTIKVEMEITWGTTQPTNLTMTVKWAKW